MSDNFPADEYVPDSVSISLFNAPYEEDAKFLHRASIAKDIQQAVEGKRSVVLCDDAGTGKSHLALQIAYDFCREACDSNKPDAFVLWIDAHSNHSILTSFHTIALQLGLPVIEEPTFNPCELVADWMQGQLSRHEKTPFSTSDTIADNAASSFAQRRYLIVLDGLESYDCWSKALEVEARFNKYNKPVHKYHALCKYLSYSPIQDCNLIVTTRHRDVAARFDAEPIVLGHLTLEEAQVMCTRLTDPEQTIAPDTGPLLLKQLGANALMINLAAANLKHTGVGIHEYIKRVEIRHKEFCNLDPSPVFHPSFREDLKVRNRPNLLLAVIAEQLQVLRDGNENLGDDDDDGYVQFSAIIARGGTCVPVPKVWQRSDLPFINDEENSALQKMMALGLARRSRPWSYTVTDIIQSAFWTCGKIQNEIMIFSQAMTAELFACVLARGRGKAHAWLPETEIVLCHPQTEVERVAQILSSRVHHYIGINFYAEAWRDANAAYKILQEMHKDNPISKALVEAVRNLGMVAHNAANFELAAKLHRLALESAKKLTEADGDHLRTQCAQHLGSTLAALDQDEDAIAVYRQAITDYESHHAEDNVYSLLCKTDLATTLCKQGHVDEASRLQEKNLAGLVQLRGEEDKEARYALGKLVHIMTLQERHAEALVHARRWVALEEKTVGPQATTTLWATAKLAYLIYYEGDKSEAYRLFKHARDGYKDRFGPNHEKVKEIQGGINELFKDRFVTV